MREAVSKNAEDIGAFLPHGMAAHLQKTGVEGELLVWVRQPSRALKAAMLVNDPSEIQEAVFALVEDILATHAQDLPDSLGGNAPPAPEALLS